MESGTKQNAVSFSAGMSNVPSNVLCSDDACSEVVGLTSENGEMKPLQKAVKVKDAPAAGDRLMYVHQLQTGKVEIYMYHQSPGNVPYLKYVRNGVGHIIGIETSEDVSVTSIGNTLIANSPTKGMQYFLWTGTSYKSLGSKIPELDVKFWLGGNTDVFSDTKLEGEYVDSGSSTVEENEGWNNVVIGSYAKLVNDIHKKRSFFAPFFALAALELYDGSYYMATTPVLLYPNFQTHYCGWFSFVTQAGSTETHLKTVLSGAHLHYKQQTDYSEWSDIVKDVTIFVTEEARLFNTDADAILSHFGTRNDANLHTTTRWRDEEGRLYQWNQTYDVDSQADVFELLDDYSDNDVIKDLSEKAIFYRLCDIGQAAEVAGSSTYNYIRSHTLENLTTQTRLDVDGGEFFDHTMKFGESVYAYNGRLHLANIRRSFFGGFKQFISKDNADTHTVRVAIETPQGVKVVTTDNVIGSVGHYFYYPDPRAKYVEIGGTIVKKLEEHKGLNGAYCIVSPMDTLTSDSGAAFPAETFSGSYELLPNKVVVSEVDNPFVFRAKGYNTVGRGEVMAIASNTTALSEGQFGQFPLYAFATDGIWALGTNETGTYSTVAPLSREVCNNTDSVTQTDSAVFFTSEKGLMVVSGSKVQCVSEQMNGKTESWGNTTEVVDFKDFLAGCSIAYDYRDSLLWVFNANGNYGWHYVYNMKSGTWSKMIDEVAWQHEVSDYPDTLLQNADGEVFSLLGKPDQNDDTAQYEAYITTRPLKFGNVMTLKSIRQMKHLKDMAKRADFAVELWAGNDCRQWVRLRSLQGQAWRYFRVKYKMKKLAATDRFIGTVFVTQERELEKLR